MRLAQILLLILSCSFLQTGFSQSTGSNPLSINGFDLWVTGHDARTIQLIPEKGKTSFAMEGGKTVIHVRFKITGYGEVSTPLSASSAPGAEAESVDLSESRFLKIRYKANQTVILQLRQTGVHGGIHNHVLLPPSDAFTTITINFSSFKDGSQPLDLKDVAKFNFAFLANNEKDGFADLVIQLLTIDRYKP